MNATGAVRGWSWPTAGTSFNAAAVITSGFWNHERIAIMSVWKPISEAPTNQPIVGGWMRRGEFRYGLCVYDERYGWASDRGAVPTHYLIAIPTEPFEPDVTGEEPDDDETDDETEDDDPAEPPADNA